MINVTSAILVLSLVKIVPLCECNLIMDVLYPDPCLSAHKGDRSPSGRFTDQGRYVCFILLYIAVPESGRLGVLYFAVLFCESWSILNVVIQ